MIEETDQFQAHFFHKIDELSKKCDLYDEIKRQIEKAVRFILDHPDENFFDEWLEGLIADAIDDDEYDSDIIQAVIAAAQECGINLQERYPEGEWWKPI